MPTALDEQTMADDVLDALVEAQAAEIRERGPGAAQFMPFGGDMPGEEQQSITTDILTGKRVRDITVYHLATNEPRTIRTTMLAKTLRKRNPDGSMAFALQPRGEYVQGQVPCWLHPSRPERATWDRIGLAGRICNSGHLASDFDARLHMQNKHPQAFKIIEEYRTQVGRDEEKSLIREQTAAIMRLVENQAGTPASAPAAPIVDLFWCRETGCSRFFDSDDGRKIHESKHRG